MISGNDITFVLSGGASNTDPSHSLGGYPSSYPITSGINNLFQNFTATQSESGYTDYRCIYVFNNNAFDSMYYVTASIISSVDGANEYFGVPVNTDHQQILVTGTATGGSFVISYDPGEPDMTINWSPVPATWAANIQNALNSLSILSGVVVSTLVGTGEIRFIVSFEGNDNHKQHPLLVLKSNSLSPSGVTVAITKVTDGAPINNIASSIAYATVAPVGITFVDATTTIDIGTLGPGEGFPVWFKRSLAPGTATKYNDGLSLKISGSPIF